MKLSISECTPYLSMTLFEVEKGKDVTVDQIRKAIRRELKIETPKLKREFQELTADDNQEPAVEYSLLHYLEKRTPAWYRGSAYFDTHNHLVVLIKLGASVGMTFTSSSARNAVLRKVQKSEQGVFADLNLFLTENMNTAFVENKVRTLWLNSTQGQSAIKPDSKVLAGLELESALDPLEDQTYYFSSLRSTSENLALSSNEKSLAIVGVRPTRGQVWIGPSKSWEDYLKRSIEVIKHAKKKINSSNTNPKTLSILAQPTKDLNEVNKAYGIAFIIPEKNNTGSPKKSGAESLQEEFQNTVQFKKIKPTDQNPNFKAKVYRNDAHLGNLCYKFSKQENGVDLCVEGTFNNEDNDENIPDYEEYCKNPDNLTIYFESGHTFARGQMYRTNFRDVQFNGWQWINMQVDGTEVDKEKPYLGNSFDVEQVGEVEDTSLFGLVIRNWPNLETPGNPKGWLVCDDGPMESADFIHLDDTLKTPVLTLIHVKGSGSNKNDRGLSVSDYEVVVGQAVKNLRHLNYEYLTNKLYENREGKLKSAVWHNGKRQRNRDKFISKLRGVSSKIKKKVVVLQPRVRKTEYDKVRRNLSRGNYSKGKKNRLRQLDALLLSARATCHGLDTEFKVIGEDDSESC